MTSEVRVRLRRGRPQSSGRPVLVCRAAGNSASCFSLLIPHYRPVPRRRRPGPARTCREQSWRADRAWPGGHWARAGGSRGIGRDWDRGRRTFLTRFKGSVGALQPGAPVDVLGMRMGTVREVRAEFDQATTSFDIPVVFELDPDPSWLARRVQRRPRRSTLLSMLWSGRACVLGLGLTGCFRVTCCFVSIPSPAPHPPNSGATDRRRRFRLRRPSP